MSAKLPKGITLEQLSDNWQIASAEYGRVFRRMRLLDAADKGRLWDAINATLPAYQILPDTNHVSYVKQNLVASLYSVGKAADLQYTADTDKSTIVDLNLVLGHIWAMANVPLYQMQAGSRAALVNIGITQIGWDQDVSGGSADRGTYYKGMPVFKNIDPMKFMRDPFASSLETSGYCMTYDQFHRNVFQRNPLYAEEFGKYLASLKAGSTPSTSVPTSSLGDKLSSIPPANAGYYRLIIHWVAEGDKIHEIHTLDNEWVLHVKESIEPAEYPFAILYCNLPEGDIVGTSECAKIFANSVAVNIMNSMILTADYKNQRPPRFVGNASQLNLATFNKHGNDADYTFYVNGDPKNAVYYHQFPVPSPQAQKTAEILGVDIQTISGVDPRYTGRDSGSVLTTGGVENMLNQVTLIDAPKIVNYEAYTLRMTRLVLSLLLKYGMKRKYFVDDPNTGRQKEITVDFPKLDAKTLTNYAINISTLLPKNRQRIAATANTLMEKQMQYAQTFGKVELITPEEWLEMQDLPNKEYMSKRMGIQRSQDYTEKVSQVLFGFAELVKSGMPPEQAIGAMADQLQAQDNPAAPQQSISSTVPPPAAPAPGGPMGTPPMGPDTMGGMPPMM